MTEDELSLANTGWGLATANVDFSPKMGVDAEPEVYEALSGVFAAMQLRRSDGVEQYVEGAQKAHARRLHRSSSVLLRGHGPGRDHLTARIDQLHGDRYLR